MLGLGQAHSGGLTLSHMQAAGKGHAFANPHLNWLNVFSFYLVI